MVLSNLFYFDRYTPTRVGKTQANGTLREWGIGTPPRVWGKLSTRFTLDKKTRYTPTRVGKTVFSSFTLLVLFGTPPRVWGKRCAV
mgnify:CR=1 FL=1